MPRNCCSVLGATVIDGVMHVSNCGRIEWGGGVGEEKFCEMMIVKEDKVIEHGIPRGVRSPPTHSPRSC